jgi:tRNA-specific adenosine deaminase 3
MQVNMLTSCPRIVKENVEDQDSVDLQHLRRFAKPKYLPPHVLGQRDKVKEMYAVPRAWESTPLAVMQAPSTTVWEYSVPAKTRISNRPPTLHLLICPTKVISLADLHELLLDYPPFCSSADSWAYPLEIKEVTVPLLAPTSPDQATMWSNDYWPTFYRKTNPFGAHPATIARAEDDLHYPVDTNLGVDEAMALARQAANQTQSRGYGIGPGCVIMERVDGKTEIISVAGDARQKPLGVNSEVADCSHGGCSGNIMGHAVMRAVGMVGRKRLRVASQPITNRAAKAERNFENCGLEHDEKARDAFFLDLPITPLEEQYFVKDNIKPDGYLCLRLEVFLTHEPCVMCSMALVHSRVGRVIFTNRMAQTGGLTAEMASNDSGPVGLGYGLCWRKELNWQFMCWEYIEPKDKDTGNVEPDDDDPEAGDQKSVVMLNDDNANVNSFASSTHV